MKISINEDSALEEIEIILNCPRADQAVRRLIAALQSADIRLLGRCRGETAILHPEDVLYIESVDRRVFLYTQDQVCETDKKLYELAAQLSGRSFFRASKSAILNLNRVKSLRPELGARLLVTMENGEKIQVSRQYAGAIKHALEVN